MEYKLQQAIELLKGLKEDAEMALDGRWDKSDDRFEAQINLIDSFLTLINE